MSNDISGFGLRLRCIASNTFPAGFDITQFADDNDPFDLPSQQIAGSAMGLNGDAIYWATAAVITVNVAVVPGSTDDVNLSVLFENNRVSRGKKGTRDTITLVALYPDGSSVTLAGGRITNGIPAKGVASAGRLKTKTYSFAFENMQNTF